MDFSFMVRTLLSTTAVDDWRGLNPFIGTAEVGELLALTATMLLHASAISSFNNTMLDCQKLIGSLGKLQEEAISVTISVTERGARGGAETVEEAQQRNMAGVLASGVVNLADQIASGLHVRRHYVDEGGNPNPKPDPDPLALALPLTLTLILTLSLTLTP